MTEITECHIGYFSCYKWVRRSLSFVFIPYDNFLEHQMFCRTYQNIHMERNSLVTHGIANTFNFI